LNEMVLSVIESHNQYQTKVEFEPVVIEPLVAKPLAIKRVLTNLIDNAVKYGSSAVVEVSGDELWVVVTIQDRGNGIPEDKLEMVFEPYFRL
ncbi:two-component sensor histidine kinase, partial [Vibrio lentus]